MTGRRKLDILYHSFLNYMHSFQFECYRKKKQLKKYLAMSLVHNFYQQQQQQQKNQTNQFLYLGSKVSFPSVRVTHLKLYKYTLCGLAICRHDVFLVFCRTLWEKMRAEETSHHILKFAAEVNISQGAVTPKISNHQLVTTVWLQLCCFVCLVPVVYILCLRCV